MTNSIVMTNAWSIAKKGQNNFGGNVKQYFSTALKMAWAIFKKGGVGMNRVNGVITDINFPELVGSEKQVAWAQKIRAASLTTLKYEVTHEEWKDGQPKRPVGGIMKALESAEATEEYLENNAGFSVKNTIETMNKTLARYDRLKEIVTNPSAKFWIDNRDNQEKNFKFIMFAEYVQTGVKEF